MGLECNKEESELHHDTDNYRNRIDDRIQLGESGPTWTQEN